MLVPKKSKHRKSFRLRDKNKKNLASRNNSLSFGSIGLKIMEPAEITSRQIEAARRSMTRSTKRGGKIWIKIFPHKVITKKGAEVPMGSGKGAPDHFVADLKAGTVVFEMAGVPEAQARIALTGAMHKLPVRCKIITNEL
jgi:large subunit ribosomal protein L16